MKSLPIGLALLGCWFAGLANAQAAEPWPDGPGSIVTKAFCGACHSLALVRSQSLTRDEWDNLLVWMSEEQNMPAVVSPLRDQLLDFLALEFGQSGQDGPTQRLIDTLGGRQGIRYRALVDPDESP